MESIDLTVTAWHPADERPTADGLYERRYWDGTIARQHWRGGRWCVVSIFGDEIAMAGGLPWREVRPATEAALDRLVAEQQRLGLYDEDFNDERRVAE